MWWRSKDVKSPDIKHKKHCGFWDYVPIIGGIRERRRLENEMDQTLQKIRLDRQRTQIEAKRIHEEIALIRQEFKI